MYNKHIFFLSLSLSLSLSFLFKKSISSFIFLLLKYDHRITKSKKYGHPDCHNWSYGKVEACYRTRSEPSRKFQPPRNVDPGLEKAMVIKTFKFGFL